MSERKDLQKFGEDFFQEIISRAEVEDMEEYRENIFGELMIEYLEESGETDGGMPCYHKKKGIQVNGYQFYEDHNTLDLFVSIFQGNNELEIVTKTDINSVFSRLNNFLDHSLEG
ncbi:abortive phage infection protein, partial [bacterium]|nr:abortive phage infection protein [bacterium]